MMLGVALSILVSVSASPTYAAFAVGDEAPNMCWNDASSQNTCLHDSTKNIRVLFYLNGHCPSCESLLNGLTARVSALKPNPPVDFLALYTEGSTEGAAPDASFLAGAAKALKAPAKGKLFLLASPDDAGSAFYELPDVPKVPDVIVLDTDETIASISDSPTIDNVIAQIKALETSDATSGSGTAITSFSR